MGFCRPVGTDLAWPLYDRYLCYGPICSTTQALMLPVLVGGPDAPCGAPPSAIKRAAPPRNTHSEDCEAPVCSN